MSKSDDPVDSDVRPPSALPRRLNTQLRLEGGANYASEDVRGPEPRAQKKGKITKYGYSKMVNL